MAAVIAAVPEVGAADSVLLAVTSAVAGAIEAAFDGEGIEIPPPPSVVTMVADQPDDGV